MEWGIYEKEGYEVEVIFWHLVGDGLYVFEAEGFEYDLWSKIERGLMVFTDLPKYGLNQRQEQFFIRVASTTPFSELWHDEEFQAIIKTLYPLGITADGPDGPQPQPTAVLH